MQDRQDLLFPLKSTSQIPAEEERFPSRAINVRASGLHTQDHLVGGGTLSLPSPRPPPPAREAQRRAALAALSPLGRSKDTGEDARLGEGPGGEGQRAGN